jgi:hypothetical protein
MLAELHGIAFTLFKSLKRLAQAPLAPAQIHRDGKATRQGR